MPSVDGLQEVG